MTRRQLPSDPKDRALLADVLAAPLDDEPRLVFADRLIEHGGVSATHGELIIVQCARAAAERALDVASPAYRAVRARERELLETMQQHWAKCFGTGSFPPGQVERGFLIGAGGELQQLQFRWRLWSAHPLEQIRITPTGGDLRACDLRWLAHKPTIQRLQQLTFATHDGTVEVDPPAAARAFREIAHDDATPLWNGPMHPRLRDVVRKIVLHNPFPDDLRDAAENFSPSLRALQIQYPHRLDAASVTPLLGLSGLLALDMEAVPPTVALAVLRSDGLRSLAELVLGMAQWTRDDEAAILEALVANARLPELESMRVDVSLDEATARALVARARRLERATFERVMTSEGLATILTGTFVPKLRTLRLVATTRLSPAALAGAPFERLASLVLEGFGIDERDAVAIASSPALATVHALRIVRSSFSGRARAILIERWPQAEVWG